MRHVDSTNYSSSAVAMATLSFSFVVLQSTRISNSEIKDFANEAKEDKTDNYG